MKPYAENLIQNLSERLLNMNCKNSEIRNLNTKLLQKITLILLRKRFANWRYKCGHRNLEESLKFCVVSEEPLEKKKNKESNVNEEEEDEEDANIPYDLVFFIELKF